MFLKALSLLSSANSLKIIGLVCAILVSAVVLFSYHEKVKNLTSELGQVQAELQTERQKTNLLLKDQESKQGTINALQEDVRHGQAECQKSLAKMNKKNTIMSVIKTKPVTEAPKEVIDEDGSRSVIRFLNGAD